MAHVIGTAGHVDHGKSTLVQTLTGIDPDRLKEEKERGLTVDLGFAWLTLPQSGSVGIVDVPGHRDFIENMLAGVGGIDLALLVVAADEGVMPQTREHLAILDLLDVQNGLVVLTKVDLVDDPDWLDLVELDIADILDATTLRDAPTMRVSAFTGQGLDELVTSLDDLLQARTAKSIRGNARLPIDRVFTISGFGTVVTGTLLGGSLSAGDDVEIVPGNLNARIRGIQTHEEERDEAQPGSRVALNLSGVQKSEIVRGQVVAYPGQLRATSLIDATFQYLPDVNRPLKHDAEVKFFSGAAESFAHVRLIGAKELAPGQSGWLQIRLDSPVAVLNGDRYILRYPSPPETIGGGVILDAQPPYKWRRFKPDVLEHFELLASGSPEMRVLHTLQGRYVSSFGQVAVDSGLSEPEVREALETLIVDNTVYTLTPGFYVATESWHNLVGMVKSSIEEFHNAFPLQAGMQREELRRQLNLLQKPFLALIEMLVDENIIVEDGSLLRLPGHTVTFSAEQQASIDALMKQIQADPVNTPSIKDAQALVGEDVLAALFSSGVLVRLNEDVFLGEETYMELVKAVRDYIDREGSITVAEARDLFGTSRKYVLALLEYLDNTGVTRRIDDKRVLA